MSEISNLIKSEIEKEGFVFFSRFMEMALYTPRLGYYIKKSPLGSKGDFVTAPEVSQLFGELLATWYLDCWSKLKNQDCSLVEIGSGNGTLMLDLLRIVSVLEEFKPNIHMVEISAQLTKLQKKKLSAYNSIYWHNHFSDIPKQPAIIIGNEFLDALPIDQFQKIESKWCKKIVKVFQDQFYYDFILASEQEIQFLTHDYPQAVNGDIVEYSYHMKKELNNIFSHISTYGGVVLLIDYGYGSNHELTSSIQAIHNKSFANELENVGETDITAHVNFNHVIDIATEYELHYSNLITQSELLIYLGLEHRLQTLFRNANDKQIMRLTREVNKLIGEKEMGHLFKAIAISRERIPNMIGFNGRL